MTESKKGSVDTSHQNITSKKYNPKQNKKKGQNASHLLNFKTPPYRETSAVVTSVYSSSPPYHNNQNRKKKNSTILTKEEQRERKYLSSSFYLLTSSNHRFIINKKSQTKNQNLIEEKNPFIRLQWENVCIVKCLIEQNQQQLEKSSSLAISNLLSSMAICPICLDEFIAPRITKCGHTFCLSCILRHLEVHNTKEAMKGKETTKKYSVAQCPCCFEYFHLDELKCLQCVTIQPPNNGNLMKFTKLQRLKSGDCLAPFLSDNKRRDFELPTPYENDSVFSRINYLEDNQSYYLNHLETDKCMLIDAIKSEGGSNSLESVFLNMALESVKHEYYQISQKALLLHDNLSNKAKNDRNSVGEKKEDLENKTNSHLYVDDDCTFFYQSSDGQLCFLSQFNITCLLEDYSIRSPSSTEEQDKSLPAAFPSSIEGRILKTNKVHLDHNSRKRYPFLSHLPLYTDVTFVELDISNYLSKTTISKFKQEFQKRRKERSQLKKKDKQMGKIAEKRQTDKIQQLVHEYEYSSPNLASTSAPFQFQHDFDYDTNDFPVMLDQAVPPDATEVTTTSATMQSHTSSLNVKLEPKSVYSFSNVCATNGIWPSLQENQKHVTDAPMTRGIWPNLQDQQKLNNEELVHSNISKKNNLSRSKGKKKGKKVVLFSTNPQRAKC